MGTQEPKSNRSSYQNFHIKEQEIKEVGSKSGRKRAETLHPVCGNTRAPICPCACGRNDPPIDEALSADRPVIALSADRPVIEPFKTAPVKRSLKGRIQHSISSFLTALSHTLLSIPAALFARLTRLAHKLQGKLECKDLARGLSALGAALLHQLKNASDVTGVFQRLDSPAAQNALADRALTKPRAIAELKEIEGTPLSPQLIAAAILTLSRLYIDLAARKKLLHPHNPAMHRAFFDVQEAMQWIVDHKETTKMCWIGIAISSLPFFKTMRLEGCPFHFQGASPLEEEFLTVVIDKLVENPVDLPRELMLVPLMTEFAKADDHKRRLLIDSLKVLDI